MSAANKATSSANSEPASNGGKKRTAFPLPSPRLNDEKSLELLRALASVSTDGGHRDPQPVTNVELGEVMDIHPTTIATANPFFADIGLIIKSVGGYLPCEELLEFRRLYEWDAETAAEALRPVFAESWFAKAIVPKMRLRGMSRDEAISDLAHAAKAGPTFRGQLNTLIYYLLACGLIIDANGSLSAAKIAPRSHTEPSNEPDRAQRDQVTEASTRAPSPASSAAAPKGPFGLVGEQGAIQFSINVQVDMKEFAGWSSDRITAFFGGIAAVLAAKGEEQIFKE